MVTDCYRPIVWVFYLPVMNVFALSRRWFDFCFDHPDKVRPSHTAIYFFAIEHCNRMGWKRKYGFPTTMVMEAVGIKSYTTYKQTLDELVEWGFIDMVERTKNQYSSNIIALSFFDEAYVKASDKALDKALSKHASKQHQSIVSIDIQENNYTNRQEEAVQHKRFTPPSVDDVNAIMGDMSESERFVDYYTSKGWMVGKTPMKDWKSAVRNWKRNLKGKEATNPVKVTASSNFWKPNLDADGRRIYD
jgi:hypothetical protein